jgi:hypothetical protein
MVALLVLLPAATAAQPPSPSVAEIEARLPSLAGAERTEALVSLTERLEGDEPRKALAYGAQALDAAGTTLDYAQRIRVLTGLTWAHMTLSQYGEAVARGNEALRLAEEQGDANAQGEALNLLGSTRSARATPRARSATSLGRWGPRPRAEAKPPARWPSTTSASCTRPTWPTTSAGSTTT